MFDMHNILVKSFRTAHDRIQNNECNEVKLHLISTRNGDARNYNLPSLSEVPVLIVGNFDQSMGQRDILIESRYVFLQRINELHPSYVALQSPILFSSGEDGYTEKIPLSVLSKNVSGVR